MLVQTQNGQIICNMDYLLSIRMEEKAGMSLLTAIPVNGDEISLAIFSSSEKCRKVLEDLEQVWGYSEKSVFKIPGDK